MSLVLEPRLLPGLAAIWRRCAAGFGDDGSPQDARSSRRIAFKLFAGIALLGAFWGSVIAVAGLNALYLCVALIGCAFILLDFRVGVVLLILLMPISSSDVFPHAMFGITGLNPLNPLLAGTLGSYLLHGCPTAASAASCRARCSGCMSRRSSLPACWVRAMSATSRPPSSCTTCSIS